MLPRLWKNLTPEPKANGTLEANGSGKLSSIDADTLSYIKSLGCTHIWLIGLLEHATATAFEGIAADPTEIVKGIAGSPYAVRDYYDIAPYLADRIDRRMQEFEALLERVHAAGLGVLMDFIPNHVARTYRSDSAPVGTLDLGVGDDSSKHFSTENCFYYFPDQTLQLPTHGTYTEFPAKATGNDAFSPSPTINDWYETVKINYGVDYLGGGTLHTDPIPTSWHRMLAILRFWADKGIDGFRCDMAEMVPEAFWTWAIQQLRTGYSLLFLAEIYQPHRYEAYLRAGFDYLYDKVGMYDCLRSVVCGTASASELDHARDAVPHQQAMCYFLENHDEQRLASDFFAATADAARPALAVSALSGTNPFLLYFAGELGECGMDAEGFSGRDGRTTIFDYWSLASLRRLGKDCRGEKLLPEERALLSYHRQVLNLCHSERALSEGAYHGLNYLQSDRYNKHRLHSFVRYTAKEVVLVISNFSLEECSGELALTAELLSLVGIVPNTPLRCTDLLTGNQSIATLTPLAPYPFVLSAWGVRILRFVSIT